MDPYMKELYAEISKLGRQVGWLETTVESIADGMTMNMTPQEYAKVSLTGYKKKFELP